MSNKTIHTQSMVCIKEIKNGVVETTDGRFVKIVEVAPINFHLRSEREKNAIIYSFASWLKIAPVKIQFKAMTRPADINDHITTMLKQMSQETNPRCKELQQDYLNLIASVGSTQGVTRQFFIIIEHEHRNIRQETYPEIVAELNNAQATIKNMLKHCGNKLVEHDDEDTFLMNFFYLLYNRSERQSLREKMLTVVNGYREAEQDVPSSLYADILAPYFVAVEKDMLVINDVYYSFAYIPSDKYKTAVYAGWMANLINAGAGIDVDVFVEKQPKDKIKNRLGQQLRINKAKIKDTQDTNSDYDDLSGAIQSGYYLRNGLLNNEDFYFMSTLITICGASREEVEYKRDFIKDLLVSQDMDINTASYHMLECFKMSMPILNPEKCIVDRGRRNLLTYGVASGYMFTAFEISDSNGILFGVNQQNSSLCVIDLYNSAKYKNANVSIMGTSGAGKTFLMQTMALRLRMNDVQTFIIAPLKGHEFKRACNAIGGSYIKISPGSRDSINILEIRPLDKSSDILIDGENPYKDDSLLSRKIQSVHAFFALIVPDMSYEEVQLLDDALISAYKDKGITHDNESLIDHNKPLKNGLPQYKEMPILEDVYRHLVDQPETKRIANILRGYVSGSAASFNRQTNVDLNNKYVVVDISEFPDEQQGIGMFVALDFIYDKVKEDRTKKKAVFIDETWKLIGAHSNPLAANFVLEIFKIIRGYGGAAIAATQDINDFFALDDGKYGRGIISNSKTKIILQLETKEAETVQDVFDLSDTEMLNITRFERGNGLVITNNNNVPVKFVASEMEEMLITTDRNKLEELRQKREMQKNSTNTSG